MNYTDEQKGLIHRIEGVESRACLMVTFGYMNVNKYQEFLSECLTLIEEVKKL